MTALPATADSGPIGYLELLRTHRDYRRLWLGEVVSFAGDWLNLIALYAVVMKLSGSGQALAAVIIAKTLPIFLVSPLAGSIVDRCDRRKVMLVADLARALCAAGLIAAHQAGSLVLLFAVLVVMVLFAGLFIPAKSAVIPQVTTPRSLLAANALSSGTWSVMLALGAAAGGAITEWVGVDASLALDGASFLVSAAFLWGLPPLPPTPGTADRPAPTGTLREGWDYLRVRPLLATTMLLKSSMALSNGALVMIPLYGSKLFPGTEGPLYLGILYGARGLGALTGSLWAGRLREAGLDRLRHLPTLGFALMTAFYVLIYAAPDIWTSAFGFFATSVGVGILWVSATTMLQLTADPGFRGRVFALEFGLMTLVSSAASWVAGLALDLAGTTPREVVLWSGLVVVLPAVMWELALRQGLRDRGSTGEG